jgi:hypothetical protein
MSLNIGIEVSIGVIKRIVKHGKIIAIISNNIIPNPKCIFFNLFKRHLAHFIVFPLSVLSYYTHEYIRFASKKSKKKSTHLSTGAFHGGYYEIKAKYRFSNLRLMPHPRRFFATWNVWVEIPKPGKLRRLDLNQ